MQTFNIYEAKTHLSKLVELIEQGEQVIIARNGKPVAELVPPKIKQKIKFGVAKGEFEWDPETFDDIDPEIQEMFYGKDWDKIEPAA